MNPTPEPTGDGRLYHFTAEHLIDAVRSKGLTLGTIPIMGQHKVKLVPGFQWITSNPDWVQSWDAVASGRPSGLSYIRTAYRIEISIPRPQRRRNLMRWLELVDPESITHAELNAGFDAHNWWVFRGNIPPHWFVEIVRNPSL